MSRQDFVATGWVMHVVDGGEEDDYFTFKKKTSAPAQTTAAHAFHWSPQGEETMATSIGEAWSNASSHASGAFPPVTDQQLGET